MAQATFHSRRPLLQRGLPGFFRFPGKTGQRPKSHDTKEAEAPLKVRLTPAETVSKAAAKVARLEAVLAALEDLSHVVEATALKEALLVPKHRPSLAERRPCSPRRLKQLSQKHNSWNNSRTVGSRGNRFGSSAEKHLVSPADRWTN